MLGRVFVVSERYRQMLDLFLAFVRSRPRTRPQRTDVADSRLPDEADRYELD
jgi:hypothetical protein